MNARKDKIRHFGYWECIRAAVNNDSLPPLAAENEFDPRPYRHHVYSLAGMGVSYLPAVSYFSLDEHEMRSPWHRHRGCVECVLCVRGEMKYESGGRIFELLPQHVFVSRPDEPHRQVSDGRKVVYAALKIGTAKKDWLSSGFSAQEWEWAVKKLKSLPRSFAGGKSVENDVRDMFKILQQGDDRLPERKFRLREVSARLVLDIIDAAGEKTVVPARDAISGIIREMKEHPENRITIDSLVERLRISPTGVLNAFKSATGLSPHAFQLKCRTDLAKTLLEKGETAEFAASRLGFASRQHFSSTFKRFAGTTPGEWRKRHIKTQM